jgi:Zn-dependent protease with chaperone function/tellurite resistance protein
MTTTPRATTTTTEHRLRSGPFSEQWNARDPSELPTVVNCQVLFEHGRIEGVGGEGASAFSIGGVFDLETGRGHWKKTYGSGAVIAYMGEWNGASIEGRWRTFNNSANGRFSLTAGTASGFEPSHRGTQLFLRRHAKKWQGVCSVDLEALRFDGEKKMLALLLADEDYLRQIREIHAQKHAVEDVTLLRGALSSGRMRLSASVIPGLFAVIDRCREALGLTAPIEVFCVNDAALNAMVTTTRDQRIVLDVTSGTIDTFEPDELAYVIGHELGHALLGHLDTFRVDESSATGVTSLRSFALKRYQEISADRVGLMCCPDLGTALRAELMFTTGITRRSALGRPEDFLAHARSLVAEVAARSDGDAADERIHGHDTHPYGELRAVAIELFHRSETFATLRGHPRDGTLSERELERSVEKLVQWMNPSVLSAKVRREDAFEFVLLAALSVASASGSINKREAKALSKLPLGGTAMLDELRAMPVEVQQIRAVELAELLAPTLPLSEREAILVELVRVARADGRVTEAEVVALEGISALLNLSETAVGEILGDVEAPLD